MKIIGLLGPAASGKSTISNYLVEKYGARRYSFAYPLKEIVRKAFGLTDEQVFGSQSEKERVDPRYGVSARWLLQKIGTEGVRSVLGPNFWWKHCLDRIQADNPAVAVVDDFRFSNEVDGFLELNATNPGFPTTHIWRIESPEDRDTLTDSSHQSEAEWSQCWYTNLVKPEVYGLTELYDAVDAAAYDSALTPAQAVLE